MKATYTSPIEKLVVEPAKVTLELSVVEAKVLGAIFGQLSRPEMEKMVSNHKGYDNFTVSVDEIPEMFNFKMYSGIANAVGDK